MPFVLFALLLISSWFIFQVLIIVPLNFLHLLGSVGWMSLGVVLLVLLSWIFGD